MYSFIGRYEAGLQRETGDTQQCLVDAHLGDGLPPSTIQTVRPVRKDIVRNSRHPLTWYYIRRRLHKYTTVTYRLCGKSDKAESSGLPIRWITNNTGFPGHQKKGNDVRKKRVGWKEWGQQMINHCQTYETVPHFPKNSFSVSASISGPRSPTKMWKCPVRRKKTAIRNTTGLISQQRNGQHIMDNCMRGLKGTIKKPLRYKIHTNNISVRMFPKD